MSRLPAVELTTDLQGFFRWRLRASNGKIVAHGGQGYSRAVDLMRGLAIATGYEAPAIPPVEGPDYLYRYTAGEEAAVLRDLRFEPDAWVAADTLDTLSTPALDLSR